MTEYTDLLLEIARCPVVERCLNEPTLEHPCAEIVRLQETDTVAKHQVPEPWSGHLRSAPILFISSNPSLSDEDVVPTGDWSDDRIFDYFEHRFGGGEVAWIRDGTKGLGRDGSYLRATMFWAAIRQRAIELLGSDVEPGVDYALTEVVHCKSRRERGVVEALDHCKARYLSRVMRASGARVIVVLGALAGQVMTEALNVPADAKVVGPTDVFGRERMVAFLPHPNARMKRTFASCMSAEEVARLRGYRGM